MEDRDESNVDRAADENGREMTRQMTRNVRCGRRCLSLRLLSPSDNTQFCVTTRWLTVLAVFFSGLVINAQVGTLLWSAPEVLEGQSYDLSADVYSFGIVLWEIWSRQLPFEDHEWYVGLPSPIGAPAGFGIGLLFSVCTCLWLFANGVRAHLPVVLVIYSAVTPPHSPGTRQLDLGPAATHYRWTAPIHERWGAQR